MKKFKTLVLVLSFAVLLPTCSWAAGNAEDGKNKSSTCAACHGVDGNSVAPIWPTLAGQNEKYLIKQMQDFKKGLDGNGSKGGRYDPGMSPRMATFTQQDYEDLAAYFSQQKRKIGAVEKALLKPGQTLYRGGNLTLRIAACIACHGPRGAGNKDAAFPALSGQSPEYVIKQLHDYKKEIRRNDPGEIMRNIADKLSEDDMKALASYVNGLH